MLDYLVQHGKHEIATHFLGVHQIDKTLYPVFIFYRTLTKKQMGKLPLVYNNNRTSLLELCTMATIFYTPFAIGGHRYKTATLTFFWWLYSGMPLILVAFNIEPPIIGVC